MGDFLSFVGLIFTGVISLLVNRRGDMPTLRERYDKVVAPMFFVIEPFLYVKISGNTPAQIAVHKILNIYAQNKSLAGGVLERYTRSCGNVKKCRQSDFKNLCKCISDDYDHCCKLLSIPVRSLRYRYKYKQFKSLFGTLCYLVGAAVSFLLSFLWIVFAVLLLYNSLINF